MTIEDVQKELNEYVKNNTEIVATGVYSDEIQINKYCKTLTAVKGKFPQFHKVMGHVVQGFDTKWQKLGEASFKHKMLQNFRQKVNLEIIPDEVLSSWLAQNYIEGKTAEEQPISKHIMDDLMDKIIDDLDILSQNGVYDPLLAAGQFGKSLDGINQQRLNALSNTLHPAFKIPLNALTNANILNEFKSYEKKLPKVTRKKIKRVFVSDNIALMYADAYELEYGTTVTYTSDNAFKTPRFKYEIVGLANVPDSFFLATLNDNLMRLIDVFEKPTVTDIQKQDYVLKIFMDWFLGYDFAINELVYIAVFDGSPRGLGNPALNKLYYPAENLS